MTAIIIINVTPEAGAQLPQWLGILYGCIYVPVCMKTHVHIHLPDFGKSMLLFFCGGIKTNDKTVVVYDQLDSE